MRYLFMCRSLTYAQRAQRVLEMHGLSANIVKAPTKLTGNGCSYCVTVSLLKGEKAAELLRSEGVLKGKIYIQNTDGTYREAQL